MWREFQETSNMVSAERVAISSRLCTAFLLGLDTLERLYFRLSRLAEFSLGRSSFSCARLARRANTTDATTGSRSTERGQPLANGAPHNCIWTEHAGRLEQVGGRAAQGVRQAGGCCVGN